MEVEYPLASRAFMAKRTQKDGGLEISFAQKNKWEKDWTRYWFYVKTPRVVPKTGLRFKKYPFTSTMGDMKPSTRVRPPTEVDVEWAACDAAFGKACRFSRGHDLVEEMVVSNF